jgi:methylmalonyl-CoA/ethylmalonyl-CoA epimerase
MRIEHIGIAVSNESNANNLFERLIGKAAYKKEVVESERVATTFYNETGAKIELLAATDHTSVIQKYIDKKGEGVHHIAFAVDDILKEIERLKSAGFEFVNETPKQGADNKRIVFLHPRSTNGVLIELCEDIKPSAE